MSAAARQDDIWELELGATIPEVSAGSRQSERESRQSGTGSEQPFTEWYWPVINLSITTKLAKQRLFGIQDYTLPSISKSVELLGGTSNCNISAKVNPELSSRPARSQYYSSNRDWSLQIPVAINYWHNSIL